MKLVTRKACAAILMMSLALSACVSPNDVAMKVGAPPEVKNGDGSAVSLRALQTRRFDTLDEKRLLVAATQTLQDLGFTVTESSVEAGVLVASKQRDAEEAGQVGAQIVVTLLLAALGSYHNPTWDKEQKIVVTLVATPIENSRQVEIRVSFDRRLTNNHGQLWRTELILDAPIYQQFFEKFSKGAFLEAHKL